MKNFLEKLKSKKNIHIVGISGAEGSAIASFLIGQNFKNITAHDFCEADKFKESFFSFHDALVESEKEKLFSRIKNSNIKMQFKSDYLKGVEEADIIFVPQSWFRYEFNKPLNKLFKKVEFCNITKLYFELCKAPIVAVTGTSGKSTTARLIYEIFKKEGKREVYFSGNDRENVQILDKVLEINEEDLLVLEVSNRQLKIDLEKSPHIGVITNISPNHLDDHKDFDDYMRTKNRLIKYQNEDDIAILNYDIKDLPNFEIESKAYYFTAKRNLDKGAFLRGSDLVIIVEGREYKICSSLDLKLLGKHNIENVLAASLVAVLSEVNTKIIRDAVTEFGGLKSRLELVRELGGVKYYNDSTACNPEGLEVAIKSFREPIILIAGGVRKKMIPKEIERMAQAIVQRKVKGLVLIGQIAEKVKEEVERKMIEDNVMHPDIKISEDFDKAVKLARKMSRVGDIVLLSPGFESFDMFSDYRDRANQFKKIVNNLS